MESYSADERSVRESCLADVESCDLYIGILGRRYGFIPPGQARSITELEYEKACTKPRLVFLKDDESINGPCWDAVTWWDAARKENDPQWIEAFRKRVCGGTEKEPRPTIFKTSEDLRTEVLKAYFLLSRRWAARETREPISGPPYPGLRAFRPTESDRFFGRDAEIESLVERLVAGGERFLAVIGASGSGKSSLVYAGLIPRLTATPIVGTRWHAVAFSPGELGDDPFQALANALAKAFPDAGWRVPELTAKLHAHPAELVAITRQPIGSDAASTQLLLFVDQFEEIFSNKFDPTRSAFFALIVTAAASPMLRVVIAMRSDFYSQWPQDETCVALLRAGHFPVGVPGQAALKEMIVRPAEAAGLTIATFLVDRILKDTGTAPGALALAEFALSQLYEQRAGAELTQEAYDGIGGVPGAIDRLAEEALNEASQNIDDDALSQLFLSIASVEPRGDAAGHDLTVVRRRAQQSELSDAALALARPLVDKRLLMTSGNGVDQRALIEVAHEAVFSHWRRFEAWYARYASDLALRRQAEQAAAEWVRVDRPAALRWGWERQKPVIEALRKLQHLPPQIRDRDFADLGIVTWGALEPQLRKPDLRRFLRPEPLALLEELHSDATPHHRREEIGLRLNQLGDPRRGVGLDERGLPEIAWIDVPAVPEPVEAERFREWPFLLARYPVTWAQYRAFLEDPDGYSEPSWWERKHRLDEPGPLLWSFDNYPAINVSWYDALAFCRWLSAKLEMRIRLPTEHEWQWAAVGATKQEYPWAGGWNSARANSDAGGIGRTVAVGLYPLGHSPFGLDDMAGNVWEWCLKAESDFDHVDWRREYEERVLRGGSWRNDYWKICGDANCHYLAPDSRVINVGFRVCRMSPIESPPETPVTSAA